ncbi:unnamed protein product, partial [Closterium sp. Naga37s-1]
ARPQGVGVQPLRGPSAAPPIHTSTIGAPVSGTASGSAVRAAHTDPVSSSGRVCRQSSQRRGAVPGLCHWTAPRRCRQTRPHRHPFTFTRSPDTKLPPPHRPPSTSASAATPPYSTVAALSPTAASVGPDTIPACASPRQLPSRSCGAIAAGHAGWSAHAQPKHTDALSSMGGPRAVHASAEALWDATARRSQAGAVGRRGVVGAAGDRPHKVHTNPSPCLLPDHLLARAVQIRSEHGMV